MSKVVLVGGLPGSGKSFCCKKSKSGFYFIDKDTVTRKFAEALLVALGQNKDDRESDVYLNNVRPIEYKTLIDLAHDAYKSDVNVMVAAPFIKEFVSSKWLSDVKDLFNDDLLCVWVEAEMEVIYKRLIMRSAPRDGWKLANYSVYVGSLDLRGIDFDVKIFNNKYGVDINPLDEAIKYVQE